MSGFGFLLILLAFVFLYFVLVRPQKRRQVAQQQMLSGLEVGDEVLTAGGIYGEVASVGDDEVGLRIAPEIEIRVARRAIAAILTDHEADADADEIDEAEGESTPEDGDPDDPDGGGPEPPVETDRGYPSAS
jgi:preprotein translocase subunit YajC